MNPHVLSRYLHKEPKYFTKEDIIRYVRENDIEMINFRYPGADGRLKTLNFIINSLEHLDNILTCGERVDGSSLFPYIEAGSSDLYVLPRYRTRRMASLSRCHRSTRCERRTRRCGR